MSEISRIGLDTSKSVFTLHAVDAAGQPVLRVNLRRAQVMPFFRKRAPTVVAMEACGGSHQWARKLLALGHEVRLTPPQYVKPYLKRGKNDRNDAEAICESLPLRRRGPPVARACASCWPRPRISRRRAWC
jgi:transposase